MDQKFHKIIGNRNNLQDAMRKSVNEVLNERNRKKIEDEKKYRSIEFSGGAERDEGICYWAICEDFIVC